MQVFLYYWFTSLLLLETQISKMEGLASHFNVGVNRSNRRKPPICARHLKTLSHNVAASTLCRKRDLNSQLKW